MQANSIKHRLAAGQPVYGTSIGDWLDPELPVVFFAVGLDFFFIDTEHSVTSYGQIKGLCRTARAVGVVPLVRITRNERSLISRALDTGAMGIIVPAVGSADEAQAVIDAMKYPPLGHRGYGLGSIVTDLQPRSAQEEINSANRESLAVMMIESREGLENVEAIASVPEVDVLFIGPYDLSLSLGIVEQFDHPTYWESVERIVAAARKVGVAVGLQSGNPAMLAKLRDMGATFLILGSETSTLLEGYKKALGALKG